MNSKCDLKRAGIGSPNRLSGKLDLEPIHTWVQPLPHRIQRDLRRARAIGRIAALEAHPDPIEPHGDRAATGMANPVDHFKGVTGQLQLGPQPIQRAGITGSITSRPRSSRRPRKHCMIRRTPMPAPLE